jgi:hypothetical protein
LTENAIVHFESHERRQEVDSDAHGFAEISGQKFFLPLHAQLNVTMQDGSQTRNEMEFGNYRKFSSEATLQFEPQ